jgi:phenylpyruvate tautomerase PptA (4-oxalocrotonate tautomerase family)
MPLLKIQSNRNHADIPGILKKASSTLSGILGKPEKYIMVSFEINPEMIFGGTNDPLLYIELKSIGLPRDRTMEISSRLSQFLSQETGVSPDRMYIEFSDAERAMWGWNGTTFER